MKKLMIAACAVAFAAAVQAATFDWVQANDGVCIAGTENYLANGITAYLFDAAVVSQDSLVKSFNGTSVSGYIDGANGATGTYMVKANGEFDYDGVTSGNKLNAYYAIVYDGNLFVSDIGSVTAQSTSTATITNFSDPYDDSTLPALDAKDGFKGQGWYSAAAVPEPTSGLLLLLGVAGLALKRKRA